MTVNHDVTGSSPVGGAKTKILPRKLAGFSFIQYLFPGCRIVQDGKKNTSCAGVSAPPDVTSQADNNTNAQNNSDNNTVIVLLVVIIAILAVALIVGIIVAVVLVKKNKNQNQ